MNQNSRQKASISVERDLFKLLNNSNFGIDCQNNIDNCTLQPLYDDIGKIAYIKKFTTILNDDIFRHFFHHVIWKKKSYKHSKKKFFHKMLKMTLVMKTRKEYYKNKMEEQLDAVDLFEK